jgi:hypothetical protein
LSEANNSVEQQGKKGKDRTYEGPAAIDPFRATLRIRGTKHNTTFIPGFEPKKSYLTLCGFVKAVQTGTQVYEPCPLLYHLSFF